MTAIADAIQRGEPSQSPEACASVCAASPRYALRLAVIPGHERAFGLLRLCFAKLLATLVGQPDAYGAGEFSRYTKSLPTQATKDLNSSMPYMRSEITPRSVRVI